jgi:glycerophosphoryl diester phosphodiesterase
MLFVCLSLALCATLETPAVYYQSHRGGVDEVPENTLIALEHSWKLPGAVPEVDLRTTKDGRIICMHDDTPERTTNAPAPWRAAPIVEIPFEEVRKWDASAHFDPAYAGTKVPTMKEAFDAMRGKPERQLYLDIKGADLNAVVRAIRAAGLEKQIIFCHGDAGMCLKLRQLYPGARTMTWCSGTPKKIRERFERLAEKNFEGIDQLQFHLKSRRTEPEIEYVFDDAYLRQAVERTRKAGVELQLRPFDFTPVSLQKLIDLGVHWYVTDAPKAFSESVRKARETK